MNFSFRNSCRDYNLSGQYLLIYVLNTRILAKLHSELDQISRMKLFAGIVHSLKKIKKKFLQVIKQKKITDSSIIDVWLGFETASYIERGLLILKFNITMEIC